MKQKVALIDNYGGNFPVILEPYLHNKDKSYIECKTDQNMFDFIEKNIQFDFDLDNLDDAEKFKKSCELLKSKYQNKLIRIRKALHTGDFYEQLFGISATRNDIIVTSISIYEIDTSRPWTITEYDGTEDIMYLDDYKCINQELNYHEK